MATIGEFVIDLTFLIIFETSSISSPTSSPTLATWGHERFSSYAATLQFSNFFIIYSKSSSTEPTRLTTIGTSSFGSIIFAKVSAPGFDNPTAFIHPPPFTLKIVGFGYPSQGSLLNDFVTTAPAPASCNLLKTSKEIPRIPDAKTVGRFSVSEPRVVSRLESI